MSETDDILIRVPVLRTERLVMRAPRASDFPAYAAFSASDRSVGVGGPYSEGQAWSRFAALIGHWHLRGYGRWMLADPADDRPLGTVGLFYPLEWPEPEIAWSLFAEAEGKGLAQEAALAARAHAYDTLGWSTVISCTALSNTRSQALARRLGCVEDGRFVIPNYGPHIIWRHPAPEAAGR